MPTPNTSRDASISLNTPSSVHPLPAPIDGTKLRRAHAELREAEVNAAKTRAEYARLQAEGVLREMATERVRRDESFEQLARAAEALRTAAQSHEATTLAQAEANKLQHKLADRATQAAEQQAVAARLQSDAARAQADAVQQLLEAARAQRETLQLQGELAMRTADAIMALGAGTVAVSDALQAGARLAADRKQDTAALTAIAREQRDAIRLVAWSTALTALTAISALTAVAFHVFR